MELLNAYAETRTSDHVSKFFLTNLIFSQWASKVIKLRRFYHQCCWLRNKRTILMIGLHQNSEGRYFMLRVRFLGH